MQTWLNYHHLYYFKTIAEEGSVSKAAEKLRLGQPTLSAQLKKFEDTIGVSLFERKHKRLILTEQGKIALDYAKSIFRMGSEMYEVLQDRLVPMKQSIHIGAIDSVPKQVIVQLVQFALKEMPCQVTLSEGSLGQLLRELQAHRIDVLVTNLLPSGADAKGIYPKLLSKKQVAMYGAPAFRKLKTNFPQSISGQPMIVSTYDSKLRYDLDHWAKTLGIELNVIVESQDIAVKKQMAINGLGIVPVAGHSVHRQVMAGELVEIGALKGISEELHLLTAQRKFTNPIAKAIFQSFEL